MKRKISKQHLGHHGIHGVGVNVSENALCIYVDPGSRLEGTEILHRIKKDAAPFQVVLIEEEPPEIFSTATKKRSMEKLPKK